MFRRKEENSEFPDTNGAASSEPASTPSLTSSAPSAPSASTHSYAPVSSSVRPLSEAAQPAAAASNASARPAASATMPSYRPTPMADLNRATAARTAAANAEPSRPAPAQSTSFAAPTPSEKSSIKPTRRVLTVGNDILLKGEIATCDRLLIEGRVEAKISDVHTVEITEVGSFKGTAEVEDAEISGVFEGDLIVRNRLVIYATGEVRGNITYGEIEIERGGKLTGQIKTVAITGKKSLSTTAPSVTNEAEKARSFAKEKESVAA